MMLRKGDMAYTVPDGFEVRVLETLENGCYLVSPCLSSNTRWTLPKEELTVKIGDTWIREVGRD